MKRRKHVQDFGFKYHGKTIEQDGTRYQIIHQTDEVSYAVPIIKEGLVGGGVVRIKR